MNVDRILDELNRHEVAYLLIGGVNFLLRHEPVLTYDVDIWVADDVDNLSRCERALVTLDVEWGTTDSDWGAVKNRKPGWLASQPIFCTTSPHGAIDIFRHVKGLHNWATCNRRAISGVTASGIPYRGLNDDDMLASQKALDDKDRKLDRIRSLERARLHEH